MRRMKTNCECKCGCVCLLRYVVSPHTTVETYANRHTHYTTHTYTHVVVILPFPQGLPHSVKKMKQAYKVERSAAVNVNQKIKIQST